MKRVTTLIIAALSGLVALAAPALAQVSVPYEQTQVGGVGGEVISNIPEPAAAGGAVAQLAQTGFDLTVGGILAVALVMLGAVAIAVARRRSAAEA